MLLLLLLVCCREHCAASQLKAAWTAVAAQARRGRERSSGGRPASARWCSSPPLSGRCSGPRRALPSCSTCSGWVSCLGGARRQPPHSSSQPFSPSCKRWGRPTSAAGGGPPLLVGAAHLFQGAAKEAASSPSCPPTSAALCPMLSPPSSPRWPHPLLPQMADTPTHRSTVPRSPRCCPLLPAAPPPHAQAQAVVARLPTSAAFRVSPAFRVLELPAAPPPHVRRPTRWWRG